MGAMLSQIIRPGGLGGRYGLLIACSVAHTFTTNLT